MSSFRVRVFDAPRNDNGEIARPPCDKRISHSHACVLYIPPEMVLDRTSMACRRVVIDDRSRLPGRFFGRFATSATSELRRAL